MIYKKNILIDLDGLLNEHAKYEEYKIRPIKTNAIKFIEELIKMDNYELYLFTSRNPIIAKQWLIDNNMEKYFKDVTNYKLPAYLIIDDRAINFDGNYEKLLCDIKNFKPYWKK